MKRFMTAAVVVTFAVGLTAAWRQSTGDRDKGEAIFKSKCQMCHGAPHTIGQDDLKGLFKRKYMAMGKPVTDAAVRNVILHGVIGQGVVRDASGRQVWTNTAPVMPDSPMPDADLDNLMAFLKSR